MKQLIKSSLITLGLVLLAIAGFSQANTVVAKVVNISQSLYLRGNRVDSISIDGNFTSNSDNILPTQKAVKTYGLNNYVPLHGTVSTLVGYNSSGVAVSIALGTNLSFSGTTLNATGGGSGVTIVGTFDSQTPQANGLFISGSNIYGQSASASNPGMVNTGAQSIAGIKTFGSAPIFNGLVSSGVNDSVLTVDPTTHTLHWRTGTSSIFVANGLFPSTIVTDTFYFGGPLNQNTVLGTAGFTLGFTGLPSKTPGGTDSVMLVALNGQLFKALYPTGSSTPTLQQVYSVQGNRAVLTVPDTTDYIASDGITMGNFKFGTTHLYNFGDASHVASKVYALNFISDGQANLGAGAGASALMSINGVAKFTVLPTGQIQYAFVPVGKNTDSVLTDSAGLQRYLPIASLSGSALTRQVITSGTSATVTGPNYLVTFDLSAPIAAYSLTMPASPVDLSTIDIECGGTITSGTEVTTLTLVPSAGQTIIGTTALQIYASTYIKLRYRSATSQWYVDIIN